MKKVLILTLSSGDNYNIIARAITNGLAINHSDVTFRTLDIIKNNKQLDGRLNGYYTITSRLAHSLEAGRYVKCKEADSNDKKHKLASKYIGKSTEYVENFIQSFAPDVIVCTHIFAAIIVSEMITKQMPSLNNVRTIYVAGDYAVIPYLSLATNLDTYVVSSADMAKAYGKVGIKSCKVLGVPIVAKVENSISRLEAREMLGIHNDNFTALVIGGAYGGAALGKMVKQLTKDFPDVNILAVCGKDKHLQEKLSVYDKINKLPKLRVFGSTNNIDIMLAAADVVIGKTSGVTIAQSIAKRVPMIAALKIKGQDLDNMKVLKSSGVLINGRLYKDIKTRLNKLIIDRDMYASVKNKMAEYYIPNATRNLVQLIEEL